jgi:hypothetical protein
VSSGKLPDGVTIADVRAICVYTANMAMETANDVLPRCRQHWTTHPDVLGRLLRDLNIAGFHQTMGDSAYENQGKFRLGLPADPSS